MKRWCDQRLRDSSFERDGFSWAERSYRCSFCSKEFMSAQALGGHMNVHRRDRARMKLHPNTPYPSPNPSLPSTSRFPSFSNISAPSSPFLQEDGVYRSSPHNEGGILEFTHFTTENSRVRKAKEFVRLDLNLGSLIQDAKEDLDLELRL